MSMGEQNVGKTKIRTDHTSREMRAVAITGRLRSDRQAKIALTCLAIIII